MKSLAMVFIRLSFRNSLFGIQFTPIIAIVTWTKRAIAKVFHNKWQNVSFEYGDIFIT